METVKDNHSKAGRPFKIIRKDIRTAVRFSKAEYFIVQQKAIKACLKVSSYMREVAINTEIKQGLNEEEQQFVRQLIGMSNNLNQLTRKAHQEGMLSAMRYFETFKGDIDNLLIKFRHA